MKDLDIVVYGATGFTGKLCAEYIHASGRPIKWAIAGRSADKLKTVQGGLSPEIEIIIADGDDDGALKAMTARAKVILSTAGPFHRYGSKLVAACVENSTHYVDITGENFWVKEMIEKHHEAAAAKGAANGHDDNFGDGSAAAFRFDGTFDGAFDLMYFDQMAEANEPTRLTLRRRPDNAPPPDYHLVPPLENVLLTRWPAAALDWNGHEVIL